MQMEKIDCIPIDREKRLILLRWLKDGEISSDEFERFKGWFAPLTDEEVESRYERLLEYVCSKCKSDGLCKHQIPKQDE